MEERFYFDTSIWLDVYEKRGKNGEVAFKLISMITGENHIVLYSSIIIKELKKLGYFDSDIDDILNIAKPNIKIIHINRAQIQEAEKLASQRNVPNRDALHAILSRDNEAHLISRDYHFQKLKDITIPKLPEEFIKD